jgi:hypothetical protein
VLDLACLLVLGPVATAWLNVIATLVTQGFVMRKPLIKVVHNLAIFALTAFASGYAFLATGGHVGEVNVGRDIVPLMTCGAVYFLCNSRSSPPCSDSPPDPGSCASGSGSSSTACSTTCRSSRSAR